jgi:dipeptidase D
VIIRKPATAGMENRKTVVLQSHLDMVHQKNSDTTFDFATQGIDMFVDNDWVRAKGTTLGADNGLGVASIMAILESKEIQHPAIEALFTIDEETGMTGALGLKGGILKGEILLNLDTEEDTEIDIGCAGGVDVTATRTYKEEAAPKDALVYTLTIKGLNGGHSGMDIHKGLGNANKLMNRLVSESEAFNLRINSIDGGSLRNAIPRESKAVVCIPQANEKSWLEKMKAVAAEIKEEFKTTEPKLTFDFQKTGKAEKVLDLAFQQQVIKSIYAAHNGVYRMSATMANLVETSNNVARVLIKDGEALIGCLTRSSVETSKFDLANGLRSAFELAGCKVTFTGSYPGWAPDVDSSILKVLIDIYEKQNGKKPDVVACHAGLECGILGSNYPGMDMISFGPTIKGAHSPDERASVSSSQKYWKFLLDILKNIPVK